MTGRGRVFRFDATLPIGGEVRRVATARLDTAVAALRQRPAPSTQDRADASAAVEDVRALLRLVRGGLDRPSRRSATKVLRAAADRIDGDPPGRPLLDAFDDAARPAADSVTAAALERLRRSLAQQSMLQAAVQALADDLGSDPGAPAPGGRWTMNPWVSIGDDLDAAILAASLWVIEGEGFAPLAEGFEREYRRAREALADVAHDLRPEAHRVLADRVADHRRHLALFRSVWSPVTKPQAKEAGRLVRLVERQHDLGVLRDVLLARQGEQLRRDARALVGVLDEDRAELAAGIGSLGARLFADEPDAVTTRFSAWWDAAAG